MKNVNVIIPCYNSGKTIKRCLDSVVNNGYKNIKIVCVDDGSEDETLAILNDYSRRDKRFVVIKSTNHGPSFARNLALNMLDYDKDEYVCFVDSDDYIDTDYLVKMVSLLEHNKVDIVTASYYTGENVKRLSDSYLVMNKYTALLKLFEDSEVNSMVHHKLYKSYLWEKVRFFEDSYFMEDTATLYNVFYNSKCVLLVDFCGYHYCRTSNSITKRSLDNDYILCGMRSLESLFSYPFLDFTVKQNKEIHKKMSFLFMDYFLTMFPYFDIKQGKEEIKKHLSFIATHKLLNSFHPRELKLRIKKLVFCLSPRLFYLSFQFLKIIKHSK